MRVKMSRNLYEVLEKITGFKAPTDLSMVQQLSLCHTNFALMELFRMNYDPRFVGFDLPEGAPPYERDEKQPYGYAEGTISGNIRKLYIFLNDYTKINRKKKEFMFQSVLESLHWREADLLVAVKDKVLSDLFPELTEAVIREAFPTLLPPLDEDDLIDAAVVIERELEQGLYKWKKYTKDEIIRLAVKKRIVFKFPEHAVKLGLDHLADSYVEPEPVYDPAEYLSFTITKYVFEQTRVTRQHIRYEDVVFDNIKAMKHAAHIMFDDLEKAKELGLGDLDSRVIEEKELAKIAAKNELAKQEKAAGIKKAGRPRKIVDPATVRAKTKKTLDKKA